MWTILCGIPVGEFGITLPPLSSAAPAVALAFLAQSFLRTAFFMKGT